MQLSFAGGAFGAIHRRAMGPLPDLSTLRPADVPPARLEVMRAAWCERVRTEFRSVQIMARFLGEVVNAGDPLDVYACALDMVADEVRHTELCGAVVAALGAPAHLPEPIELREAPEFQAAPPAERALATAITMLGINETLSAGYIADLHARCRRPDIRAVLAATIEDEEEHRRFGWLYIEQSLARFPSSTLRDWRHLVTITLAPHEGAATRALADLPAERQQLELFQEPDLADLGLFSRERQALVYRATLATVLLPRLRALRLAS